MFGSLEQANGQLITGNTLVKRGAGHLIGILCNNGTPTVSIYDGADNTGRKIVHNLVCAAATPYPIPALLQFGLYVESTGAEVTVFWD